MTEHFFSKIDPKKLLHILYRIDDARGRQDISPQDQFLQAAALCMDQGKTFQAHRHIWKDVPFEQTIAQESWVVLRGSVKVFYYDIDDRLLSTNVIAAGDCSITFEGGHNYEILENDTLVYEFKTGPYQGQELDKRFINTQ